MNQSPAAPLSPRVSLLPPALLSSLLGSPRAPLIIDVRKTPAFDADARMIAGAIRRDPASIATWPEELSSLAQGRDIVVYCVHGHEVSQGAATHLAAAGFNASYLEGGIEAWKSDGAPTIRKLPDIGFTGASATAWITRERPKIDRIACPWLIRRFIDPFAGFHYVPADMVLAEATKRNAIPYDIPGAQFSHRGPGGERCSFDAMLEDFALTEPSLLDLATIVRGADTGHTELSPQSSGLLAVSLGLSVNFPEDHAMLEHGMTLYDALYAWLKSARGERHNASLFETPAGTQA